MVVKADNLLYYCKVSSMVFTIEYFGELKCQEKSCSLSIKYYWIVPKRSQQQMNVKEQTSSSSIDWNWLIEIPFRRRHHFSRAVSYQAEVLLYYTGKIEHHHNAGVKEDINPNAKRTDRRDRNHYFALKLLSSSQL